jgi:hypothetical protein
MAIKKAMAKFDVSADASYKVRKDLIVEQTMSLINSMQAFEDKFSDHLNGKDLDDFSRVIVAVRNAGIMAISDLNA